MAVISSRCTCHASIVKCEHDRAQCLLRSTGQGAVWWQSYVERRNDKVRVELHDLIHVDQREDERLFRATCIFEDTATSQVYTSFRHVSSAAAGHSSVTARLDVVA